MTTRNAAHAIVITIERNEQLDRPALVSVTGPQGQWSAALSMKNWDNFRESIASAVDEQLLEVLDSSDESWPGHHGC